MAQTPESAARVFFVDDEEDVAASLADRYPKDYEAIALTSPDDALVASTSPLPLNVAGHRMPGMTGVELLAKLQTKSRGAVRFLLSAAADLVPLLTAWGQDARMLVAAKSHAAFHTIDLRARTRKCHLN